MRAFGLEKEPHEVVAAQIDEGAVAHHADGDVDAHEGRHLTGLGDRHGEIRLDFAIVGRGRYIRPEALLRFCCFARFECHRKRGELPRPSRGYASELMWRDASSG